MSVVSTLGIENFYQRAVQQGFARDYQFRVLRFGQWIPDPQESLYITTATMPGRTVTAVGVPFMGLNFQVPGAANYKSNSAWAVLAMKLLKININSASQPFFACTCVCL